jgi:sugar/nucleoside kinase (ribokinase family)
MGNWLEYHKLFPEMPVQYLTKEGFGKHIISQYVQYALLTLGEEGMVAYWDGNVFSVDAEHINPELIVNTSGAGDVATGVFCGGIVEHVDCLTILRRAAISSKRVLQVASSMIIGL